MTDFSRECIKTCINNVTRKKQETLLNQRFSLFVTCPNFDLGTLFCIEMDILCIQKMNKVLLVSVN